MTAAFDLTSWRDTIIRGGLPAPARTERWQPLRAGVVNLWEYDAAEVWYADGRLQLQGAHEGLPFGPAVRIIGGDAAAC